MDGLLDDEEDNNTFRFEACEDKDEIVVEIWKLIKLLQFLQVLSRSSNMCSCARTREHTLVAENSTHSDFWPLNKRFTKTYAVAFNALLTTTDAS